MPPPILKYVDLARLVGAGLKCPVCTGTHCRRSRWHSKEEKLSADGFRPYRCHHCSHRFLARDSASLERILVNGTAGVLLGFGVLVGVELWLDGVDEEKRARIAPASTAYSEESTTAVPTRLLTGDEVADAGEDPAAARAKTQQEAAENGDADAMLQLGRDLATGNQRPKDVEQAAHWVKLAAASGNPEGMLQLGRFYRDGLGVMQDAARAYVWFDRAAAKHPGALQERDALVRAMSKEQLQEAHQLSLPSAPAAASSVPNSEFSEKIPASGQPTSVE
jgi:hypothetical protein